MDEPRAQPPAAAFFGVPPWVMVLAFWLFIGILYTGQSVMFRILNDRPLDWGRTISYSMAAWLVWAALTPAVVRFARAFPVLSHRRGRRLLVHFGAAVGFALLQMLGEVAVNYSVWLLAGEEIVVHERFLAVLTYRFHIDLLIYGALTAAVHWLDGYRALQARELETSRLQARTAELRRQLAGAELNALKMQLQPHFLFNTHNAIQALIVKGENQKAAKMLSRLSSLLRLSLDRGGRAETSLDEELVFLDLYLELQQMRFGERLRVERAIEVETRRALVPGLILQPLVENAVVHGIGPVSDAGLIRISAFRRGHQLVLEVADDGRGLDEGSGFQEGIGLSNTRARLTHMYDTEQDMVLGDAPEGGFLVQLVLPFRPLESRVGAPVVTAAPQREAV